MWSKINGLPSSAGIDILMYHSISREPGPTCITPAVFEEQMELLAEAGYGTLSLASLPGLLNQPEHLTRKVIITFDDGYQDFADQAFPILHRYGFTATVFLPTGRMGSVEDWYGANQRQRPLMSWRTVQSLAQRGIEFGGHTVSHADLTAIDDQQLRYQIEKSQNDIAEHLNKPTVTFAPPYGRTNARVQAELAKFSRVSVGTKLDRAALDVNLNDCPRLEMFYFQLPRVWSSYLKRSAEWYLPARRAVRRARQVLTEHRWRTAAAH